MTYFFIEILVKTLEEITSLIVPRPPHVMCELIQTLKLLREARLDIELFPLGGIGVISFDFHMN